MSDSRASSPFPGEERFQFGANWRRFLRGLDDQKIHFAEASLESWIGTSDLRGKKFLDIGSGSGLFSLSARRLGAQVHSFDYDPQSVACTQELKRRYFPDDPFWTVERGDVLDRDYLKNLGQWDIVYSWGVLHHTGDLWRALDHVTGLVSDGGLLFIALYNDQGRMSQVWKTIKRTYVRLPDQLRTFFVVGVVFPKEITSFLFHSLRGSPGRYFQRRFGYGAYSRRGMSWWYNTVDWIGGYPFEVSKPEEVFDFFRDRGFVLRHLRTCAGAHGCNEYLFKRE